MRRQPARPDRGMPGTALRRRGLNLGQRRGVLQQRHRLSSSERYCQELTRREARNFYWGFLALPKHQRVAIYALYSFSRQVDDDVDLGNPRLQMRDGSHEELLERCARQRLRVADCYRHEWHDPVTRVLCDVVRDYNIPEPELLALIRGVEMDLENDPYPTWTDLETYCRHVASAVGRMCARIFGFSDPVALQYADDLGIAMQLTNILRDIREDYELGRVYLPLEDLSRFGISPQDFGASHPQGEWEDFVRFQVERAQRYFASGLKITNFIPRRAAVCVLTMAGMYQKILEQVDEDPFLPLHQRAHLRKRTKLKVMFQSWLSAV